MSASILDGPTFGYQDVRMVAGNVRHDPPSPVVSTIGFGPTRAAGVRGERFPAYQSAPAHDPSHDPIELHAECLVCGALLRRAFNDVLPRIDLGPNGASMLLQRLREILADLAAAS